MLILGLLDTIHAAGIWIVVAIYHVAAYCFELFLILSTGQLLDAASYETMIHNFYIVLGIIMLFTLAFALLRGMVDPGDSKQGTSMVKKTIINLVSSAVIMALLPTIFSFAFDFQDSIITNQNTIGKFFGYGSQGSTNDSPTDESNLLPAKQGAYRIVNGVFTAFFNVNQEYCEETISDSELNPDLPENKSRLILCQEGLDSRDKANFGDGNGKTDHTFLETSTEAEKKGKLGLYSAFASNVTEGEIDFNFFLALIAGILLIYVAVSFCFDMAVRLVKLVFYQLIAPIPVFLRVVPDSKLSGTFKEWIKVTLACYMEVYVRIFVFYFCIYLCNAMLDTSFLSEDVFEYGVLIGILANAFVIMGIIMFMRQAPKLIGQVVGVDSGNMKLGIREKLRDGGFFAATNAVGGAIAGGISGKSGWSAAGGALSGLKHGWKNADLKGIGAASKRGYEYRKAKEQGMTFKDTLQNTARGWFGFDTTADSKEREIRDTAKKTRNPSAYDIVLENDQILKSGESADITQKDIDYFDAKIEEKKGTIATAQEELKQIEKSHKFAEDQKGLKKFYEKDADGKWLEGKYTIDVAYRDLDGNIQVEKINGNRFEELQKMGVSFLDTKPMHYAVQIIDGVDANGKKILRTENLTLDEIRKKRREGVKIDSYALNADEVRQNASTLEVAKTSAIQDLARAEWITSELSSHGPNGPTTVTSEFIETIRKEGGFTYRAYEYDPSGNIRRDEDGNPILQENGKITSDFELDEGTGNNVRVVFQDIKYTDGRKEQIKFKEVGYGQMQKVVTKYDATGRVISTTEEYIVENDFAAMMDKLAKNQQEVLNDEKAKIERETRADREAIAGMESVKTAYSDVVKGKLSEKEQRGRKAAKTYYEAKRGK